MIRFLILFCLIFSFQIHKNFVQETTIFNVTYEFKYLRDASSDKFYKSQMILSLGKTTSRYIWKNDFLTNVSLSSNDETNNVNFAGEDAGSRVVVSGGPAILINNGGVVIREEIVKDFKDRSLVINSKIGPNLFEVKSALPQIKWEIKSEKKKIDKYICQKAIGEFGGRRYIIWFAPELHFNDGPWKFSGLPGLILQARDERNEVIFSFIKLDKNTNPSETTASIFGNDLQIIPVKFKQYKKAKMAYEMNPENVFAARFPNFKPTIINIENSSNQKIPKIRKYNEIEIVTNE